MKRIFRSVSAACLILVFNTGCQATKPCPSISHVDQEVRVEVSDDGSAMGRLMDVPNKIKFNGKGLSDLIGGNEDLSKGEIRELEKEALKQAKENIGKASEWICDKCTLEETCKAYTTDSTKLKLKNIKVTPKQGGGWSALVTFKLTGEIKCGSCEGEKCGPNPQSAEIQAAPVVSVEEVKNTCSGGAAQAQPEDPVSAF